MKQVLQNLRSGQVEMADVPCPQCGPGRLLIQTRASLISAGTERMLVEFGKANLLAKARAQPEKVRQVLEKIKADGLLPTLEAVFARLDEPLPLGYCNTGVVLEVGSGVAGFGPGDHVANNGPHAEVVCVPQRLCARIPGGISDEQAAFCVLASIGLQGVRLVKPSLGETVVVTGLGLIGLMTVQLLTAGGCRVLGIDIEPRRLQMASRFGAETVDVSAGADPVAAATAFSRGRGVDAVIITASSKSNDLIHQAAQMCRKRGRIVLVGVVGMEINRSDFYKKELSFQVSCSYGPGRYDPAYEERGEDYPLGFVRWTEQRNFEAVLDLLAARRLEVEPLIDRRIPHAQAAEAYRSLTEERGTLGIILTYPAGDAQRQQTIALRPERRAGAPAGPPAVGVIGAGNYSRVVALPLLRKADAQLVCLADLDPVAAGETGRKFGFERSTTDYRTLLSDRRINAVFVFTRHNAHARLVLEALEAGKHVFVEKPLCLNQEELERIRAAHSAAEGRQLLVGFNRRFSPHAVKMKSLLASRTEPLTMSMMVNAGVTPATSWTQDPLIGGGRIVGEGCHWMDLMSFLAGAPVIRVVATRIGGAPGVLVRDDKATITLSFADGSLGTLHYFGNGHRAYPKETLEVFCAGRVLRLDNFRALRGYGWSGFSKLKLRRMDKGHGEEFARFLAAVAAGGPSVIPFAEIENVMRAAFAVGESFAGGTAVSLE